MFMEDRYFGTLEVHRQMKVNFYLQSGDYNANEIYSVFQEHTVSDQKLFKMGLVQEYMEFKANETNLLTAFIRLDNTKKMHLNKHVYSIANLLAEVAGLWRIGYFVLFCVTFLHIRSSFMTAILSKLFLMKRNSITDCT